MLVLEGKPGNLTRELRLGESRNKSKVTLLTGVAARIQRPTESRGAAAGAVRQTQPLPVASFFRLTSSQTKSPGGAESFFVLIWLSSEFGS